MKRLVALIDYKAKFGSKHFDSPYRSGMDKDKLKNHFRKLGFDLQFEYLNEICPGDTKYINQTIIYTSSEDIGYRYKAYIEDVILSLELAGAHVIPHYKHLRANNNKVFMELMASALQLPSNLKAHVFGSLKDLRMRADTITYPAVFKTSEGASGSGVFLVHSQKELETKIKSLGSRSYWQDLKDYGRAIKHPNYQRESIYRYKFILQEFVPKLSHDWKIYMFGDKLYVFRRPIMKGRGIKASGGGYDNYFYDLEAEAPDGLFDYVSGMFRCLNVPHLSIDVVYDGTNFYTIEYQSLYFGTAGIPYSKGYFSKEGDTWNFVEKKLEIEQVYVESIAQYIEASTRVPQPSLG